MIIFDLGNFFLSLILNLSNSFELISIKIKLCLNCNNCLAKKLPRKPHAPVIIEKFFKGIDLHLSQN